MSMQQSEAQRERPGRATVVDVPPPSLGALNRVAIRNRALARRRAAVHRLANEVAEARALGVPVVDKLTIDRSWNAEEDAALRALYPDLDRLCARLPHRSRGGIRRRAYDLDLLPPSKRWFPAEIATLRRLWLKATTAEMCAALPRWSREAIDHKARKLGLNPRGRPPLKLTGDPLCDAIRDRCRVLGYSMAYLDRLACSGTYFQACEWKNSSGHRLTPVVRALHALGGALSVEWGD